VTSGSATGFNMIFVQIRKTEITIILSIICIKKKLKPNT